MHRIQKTLIQQCDALINLQNNDKASDFFGGFYCPACGIYHGRADNAVFPPVWAAQLTGDKKYLASAEKTLIFRQKLTEPDGGVFNDFGAGWKGITVSGKTITVDAEAHFCSTDHSAANEKLTALFRYVFAEDAVNVSCRIKGQNAEDIKLIVPVIENSAALFSETPSEKRRIFFLSGGFTATEHSFRFSETNRIDFSVLA